MKPEKSKARIFPFIGANCASCALFKAYMHADCRECDRRSCSVNPKPMWRDACES